MRTTVAIDYRLLEASKSAAAAARRQTLGQYVEEALRLSLATRSPATAPPSIPVFTRDVPGGMNPSINPSSNRSLYDFLDGDEGLTS